MLLEFCYDDRKVYKTKRGAIEYTFDPTCEVINQNDIKFFLGLKPKTFRVSDAAKPMDLNEEQCPYCDRRLKNKRSLVIHVSKHHGLHKEEFKSAHPEYYTTFFGRNTSDTGGNSKHDSEGAEGQG